MKRIAAVILVLLASVLLLAGCASRSERSLEINVSGHSAYVKDGDCVFLELKANPTTGFQWMVGDVPSSLSLLGNDYQAAKTKTPVVGGGGITTISFKALCAGTSEVVLTYKRSWEEGRDNKTLKLVVTAEEKGGKIQVSSINLIPAN